MPGLVRRDLVCVPLHRLRKFEPAHASTNGRRDGYDRDLLEFCGEPQVVVEAVCQYSLRRGRRVVRNEFVLRGGNQFEREDVPVASEVGSEINRT
jgi:hypothetical protein